MTVTVETPMGEVSGSSVSEVSWQEHLIRMEGMGWDYRVTGEAVVVEITPGRNLFALPKGAGTTEYMGSVASASISGQEGRVIDAALFDEVRDKRDRAAGPIVLPDYQYPMLMTFSDITDPTSVELVDPADLPATFGSGMRLKSIVLEVTDEPVTVGRVKPVLPWFDEIGSNYLDGRNYETIQAPNRLANSLGPGWFSTETGE